jgi:hypothetical protein
LAQQLFRLDTRFVLDFEFAGALFDRCFQCFGEGSELSERPLSFRDVNTDADDAYGKAIPRTGEVSLDPLRWGLIPYWCHVAQDESREWAEADKDEFKRLMDAQRR